jgi:hypothetical protein
MGPHAVPVVADRTVRENIMTGILVHFLGCKLKFVGTSPAADGKSLSAQAHTRRRTCLGEPHWHLSEKSGLSTCDLT